MTKPQNDPNAPWQLVWTDEFDYDGLPDPARWGYEEGFIRNHEAQYYTRGRRENVRVEGGRLVIEGRREPFANAWHSPASADWREQRAGADYTAAAIVTAGRSAWTYGRFEMRARLPRGAGAWPAFWLLGARYPALAWPQCGEIDIMEFVGKQEGVIHATVHHGADGVDRPDRGTFQAPGGSVEGFHVYAVEWSAERMDFFFDGQVYHSFRVADADAPDSGGNPFHQPHYLLLNLALGGTWGGPVDDAALPQQFVVDYVRVFQRPPERPSANR